MKLIPDTSVPVLLIRLSADLFPYGALGIVRSLGRLGVPVFGVHDGAWNPDGRSRYAAGRLIWHSDSVPGRNWVDRLLQAGRTIGGRPILIPTDDVGAMFLAGNANVLREHFRFPLQSLEVVTMLARKKDMHYLCRELGIPTPGAFFPQSREDVFEFMKTSAFPVVVKSIDPWLLRFSTGGRWVDIARSPEELLDVYEKTEAPEAPNVMLQEYIPGGSESVWMFNGYLDERSECLVGFTGRKLRQHPPGRGVTSLGVCEPNDAVERAALELLKALGYRGIVDMGFRFDPRDGRYKLLDVNPRVGATFRLFVGAGGLDVVRALYLDLTGQPVPADVPVEGRKWIVENYDVLASLRGLREGTLTFREWAHSLKGVREAAWFSPDDPVPFALMGWRSLAKLMRRGTRLERRRRAGPSRRPALGGAS